MKIPDAVLPALRKATSSCSLQLEFWKSDSGDRIMDCFFELAICLTIAKLDFLKLPKGYGLATLLFRWESECQTEGWQAFEWIRDISKVAEAYSEVGLRGEGDAISRAAAAWKKSNGSADAATTAYNIQLHPYSVDLDRLEYLVDYFCERASEMFYEKSNEST